MPNLRFLDSSPISDQEREEALRRCYWMGRKVETSNINSSSVSEDCDQSSDATSKDTDLHDVTHTIKLAQPGDIAPNAYLSNPSQIGENFQLLAVVPDNLQESGCNQILNPNQTGQQPRGDYMRVLVWHSNCLT